MLKFKVGDRVYDSSYRCLVEILELSEIGQVKVRAIGTENIYYVYRIFLNTLEDTKPMLQDMISKYTNLIMEIEEWLS